MTTTEATYCPAHRLPRGEIIYLYGWRTVIDVHNTRDPQRVRVATTDGTFYMDRNTLVSLIGPEEE